MLMGIIAFLIIVLTSYLIYVPVWLNAFLVATIDVNSIHPSSKDRFVLRLLALSAQILAVVMLILLVFFTGLTGGLINKRLKSGQFYFFFGPEPGFFNFKLFYRSFLRAGKSFSCGLLAANTLLFHFSNY